MVKLYKDSNPGTMARSLPDKTGWFNAAAATLSELSSLYREYSSMKDFRQFRGVYMKKAAAIVASNVVAKFGASAGYDMGTAIGSALERFMGFNPLVSVAA